MHACITAPCAPTSSWARRDSGLIIGFPVRRAACCAGGRCRGGGSTSPQAAERAAPKIPRQAKVPRAVLRRKFGCSSSGFPPAGRTCVLNWGLPARACGRLCGFISSSRCRSGLVAGSYVCMSSVARIKKRESAFRDLRFAGAVGDFSAFGAETSPAGREYPLTSNGDRRVFP